MADGFRAPEDVEKVRVKIMHSALADTADGNTAGGTFIDLLMIIVELSEALIAVWQVIRLSLIRPEILRVEQDRRQSRLILTKAQMSNLLLLGRESNLLLLGRDKQLTRLLLLLTRRGKLCLLRCCNLSLLGC